MTDLPKWSPQQVSALKRVATWLSGKHEKQVFRLFGYAGTGKTTLAKEIAELANGRVLFCTFTGKASLVLRQKGCEDACTIHSLIYKPVEDPVTGITEFKLNPDSAVAGAALVIIDEVSMVGEDLARDLLSFGTKILVLGDPAQLPPVKGEGFFISAKPDIMLTEVHRQAAENPIIRMSMDVREGRGLTPGTYGESRIVLRSEMSKDELQDEVLRADQVLCGLNKTRQAFNLRAREIKGLAGTPESWHPTVGDRLVCLRNDREKGLLNGGLWEATEAATAGTKFSIRVKSLDVPEQAHVDVEVWRHFFLGTDGELDWKVKKLSDQFTYGQVLTCHKAQGSQWPGVLVFDESSVFREDAAKWTYTAITRAAERVTVVI
jgi:exodeoxyribonuclease-5